MCHTFNLSKSDGYHSKVGLLIPWHGEIIYGGTRWIEDDCSATFSEYIFLFPACLMISHWLTKNAELNSVF